MHPRSRFGNHGEQLAATYLQKKGYVVIARQYRTRVGEIDLVCLQDDEVVFVEVKTRRTQTFGYPEASVTPKKIQRILRTIEVFLRDKQWTQRAWRIDVIAITFSGEKPEIVHFSHIDNPAGSW